MCVCEDCSHYEKRTSDGGVCRFGFGADATPPNNIRSKKKLDEWLKSDAWKSKVSRDDCCTLFTSKDYSLGIY